MWIPCEIGSDYKFANYIEKFKCQIVLYIVKKCMCPILLFKCVLLDQMTYLVFLAIDSCFVYYVLVHI